MFIFKQLRFFCILVLLIFIIWTKSDRINKDVLESAKLLDYFDFHRFVHVNKHFKRALFSQSPFILFLLIQSY